MKSRRCMKADRSGDQTRRWYYWKDHVDRVVKRDIKLKRYSDTGRSWKSEGEKI